MKNHPAKDYLDATLFDTGYDVCDNKSALRYGTELERCADYTEFHIAINGTWSADTKDGGCITSYEKIGYNAYTADLLQAVLDSDCAFYVHRYEDGEYTKHDMRKLQATQKEGLQALLAIQ